MIYKIEKGNHYCNFNLGKLQPFATEMIGTINIDISWWHESDDIPYSGWNKLVGISEMDVPFCKKRGIHWNSGRLVMQPAEEYGWFRIAGYVYSEGVREEREFIKIQANKDYEFCTIYSKHHPYWAFMIDDTSIWMSGVKPRGITRKCYPYFGGKSVAINNCITEIKRD